MDLDDARAYLADHHRAVLLTRRSDGSPQLSPVLCGLGAGGTLDVSTRQTAMKAANIRRHPDVALCVVGDGFFGRWIQVEGTADVVALPEAMEGLVALYRTISGEHPDWDDYRAGMVREQRCLLRITLRRAGPDRQG